MSTDQADPHAADNPRPVKRVLRRRQLADDWDPATSPTWAIVGPEIEQEFASAQTMSWMFDVALAALQRSNIFTDDLGLACVVCPRGYPSGLYLVPNRDDVPWKIDFCPATEEDDEDDADPAHLTVIDGTSQRARKRMAPARNAIIKILRDAGLDGRD